MPTLRQLIDGTGISAGAPVAKNPSPVAKHIANHISDPLGATKDGFTALQTKKQDYDNAREEMSRNLAPVQSTIDMVRNYHGIDGPTPGLNNGINNGNPDDPQLDEFGNPINMGQTPGQMNQNRPSMAGNKPGVAPGGFSGNQVVPNKMGVPKAGQGNAGTKAGNPGNAQGNTYNPQAKSPKGSKSLPGAKGPGDPKVANKSKQAEKNSSSGRAIKVNVTANNDPMRLHAASSSMERAMSRDRLSIIDIQAGPASLQDKDVSQGTALSYNPKMNAKGKKSGMCKACGKMNCACKGKMKATGKSLGAKKGWSTRGKGHLSKVEKDSHYANME